MPVHNCAIIGINDDGNDYVHNVEVFAEEGFEYLQEIWPMFTGMRVQRIEELEPADPYVKPVWIQWISMTDGWHPPVEDRAAEEDAN